MTAPESHPKHAPELKDALILRRRVLPYAIEGWLASGTTKAGAVSRREWKP